MDFNPIISYQSVILVIKSDVDLITHKCTSLTHVHIKSPYALSCMIDKIRTFPQTSLQNHRQQPLQEMNHAGGMRQSNF